MIWAWIACTVVAWIAVRSRVGGLVPVDPPGARKSQSQPIPLAGGLCGVCVLCIAWLWPESRTAIGFEPALMLGTALALATGYLDDLVKKRELPTLAKLAGQCIAATTVFAVPELGMPPLLAFAWLVLCMNAWNFLDNTDGVVLATGIGATLPLILGTPGMRDMRSTLTWVLATLVAFLPFNWPKPRAYFGDAGAHALGFALGAISLQMFPTHGIWALLAVHAVALLDMLQVMTVRVVSGIAPWHADRRHVAHRLQQWLPTPWVAPIFFLAQACALVL